MSTTSFHNQEPSVKNDDHGFDPIRDDSQIDFLLLNVNVTFKTRPPPPPLNVRLKPMKFPKNI